MPETELDRANATRIKQLDTLDRLAQKFGQSLSGALTRNLGAGRQLESVLGSLGTKLAGLAVKAALRPVKQGITSLVNGLLSTTALGDETAFARGGVIGNGRVRPFAEGGIVAAPTYFPMQGGTGLMGEAGPEAILPLRRGSDGRLGVAAGSGGRPVSVTVNIATPDLTGFRRSEAQVAASLARAVARGQRAL
ncbi:phage tail tape measure protein [Methylobacterium soli]|uniref:Phage tail tape measure protein n=1 Tax=Methylobacterium soli TaxID=553447 RepID=A0A6L3STM7_9HYPH|nr:phage tail tape measure protein [Methylobacterium soli]KAB1076933.1 phage tail tape measure protein [Methylobacterium soli]